MPATSAKVTPPADPADATLTGTAIPTGAELVTLLTTTPNMVLMRPEIFPGLMVELRKKIDAGPIDLTTKKGRDARISQASFVTRSKTALADATLAMTADLRRRTDSIREASKPMVAELDAYAKEVRQPVTEWEEAEADRVGIVSRAFVWLNSMSVVHRDATAEKVGNVIAAVSEWVPDKAVFLDRTEEAVSTRDKVLFALQEAHARIVEEEAGRAELELLRAEKVERDRQEAERQAMEKAARVKTEREDASAAEMLQYIKQVKMGFIGGQPYPSVILLRELEIKIHPAEFAERHQEAIEAARVEAHAHITRISEEALAKRLAEDEKAEAERIAAAEKRASEQTAADTKRRADEALAAAEAAHRTELEKVRREAAEAEVARRQEIDRQAAWDKRVAEDEAKRAAGKKHRAKVKGDVHAALLKMINEEPRGLAGEESAMLATRIIDAIIHGDIPHTAITF